MAETPVSPEAPMPADSPTSRRNRRYRTFWDNVGDNFPDLGKARSTLDYRLDEQRLFRSYLRRTAGGRQGEFAESRGSGGAEV